MQTENRLIFAGVAVALVGALFFAILAGAVLRGDTAALDVNLRYTIHSWASPLLTRAMEGVTLLGSSQVLLPLGILIVLRLHSISRPRAALLFAIAALGAEACDQILKFYFRRPRPEVFFGLSQPATYSFPSGHSVASCCFYGSLAAILSVTARTRTRKAAIWTGAAIFPAVIGFSRVYLGVHYPTDVIGGYSVAIVWAALVHAGYQIWLRRRRTPSIS